jgi:hypothetical protein
MSFCDANTDTDDDNTPTLVEQVSKLYLGFLNIMLR